MRAAVILAGGRGTRAKGSEKTLFTYQGETFLERQIQILSSVVDEILISCRDEKQKEYVSDMVHLPCIVDKIEGMGPIGGIYASFLEMQSDTCFLVAGDMPLLHREAISYLFQELERDPYCAGVVPCWLNENLEPLHAVYRKEVVLSYLIVNTEVRKMHTLLSHLPMRYISVESLRIYDPMLRFLINVNTHDDLYKLEQNDS
ncbi:MAG: molybdenum cofactor guanylyltransferase [Methanomicrobiales archaeon]|jgi:molybdopterin-guanine dinucleotide biosynthesis protein A|nr:molybdenum cofactor guanylyltransferase [Methanomicrobiales archaeon]